MSITALRQQLDAILAAAADNLDAQTASREAELARAWEEFTIARQDSAIWRAATQAATERFVALIDLQLETLSRGGLNATALRTLRRQVTAETP